MRTVISGVLPVKENRQDMKSFKAKPLKLMSIKI